MKKKVFSSFGEAKGASNEWSQIERKRREAEQARLKREKEERYCEFEAKELEKIEKERETYLQHKEQLYQTCSKEKLISLWEAREILEDDEKRVLESIVVQRLTNPN